MKEGEVLSCPIDFGKLFEGSGLQAGAARNSSGCPWSCRAHALLQQAARSTS